MPSPSRVLAPYDDHDDVLAEQLRRALTADRERWERYQQARLEEDRRFVDAELRPVGQDRQSLTGFDPLGIIDVLARHDKDFVVIGGFAAELYRAPVSPTTDIDVTPSMTAPNLTRLSAALYELGARIRTAEVPEGLPFSHDASSLARAGAWNLTTTAGNFRRKLRPSGTDGSAVLQGLRRRQDGGSG